MSHIQYLLLGLGGGAVLAALALGLVLAFRASGVVNFAHAAMGMYLAYTYFALRESGELLVPVIGLPDKVRLLPSGETLANGTAVTYRFSWATALIITLVLAALYGLVVYMLAFRPLREAPTLARVAASLGLFLYLLAIARMRLGDFAASVSLATFVALVAVACAVGAVALLAHRLLAVRSAGSARAVALGLPAAYLVAVARLQLGTPGKVVAKPEALLPQSVVEIGPVSVQQDRLWLAGLVVLVASVLGAAFTYTRFGLATRAAAESEKGAVLIGLSPTRIAAVNWMIATVLAGGAVILIAPIANLNPASTSLLIVPAMAAALLGRFTSFTITVAAGLGIGMLQSEILNLRSSLSWLPDLDLQYGVPFVLIILTLALSGRKLPTRATLHEGRFPRSPTPRHLLVWTVVLSGSAIAGLLMLDSQWRSGIIVTSTTAIVALSVVVLTGYVGQISLMPMALAGIGAFTMVKLTTDFSVPFPVAPLLGALAAVVVGLVAGIPAVRVRGMNLAIATLAAAVAIEELILKWGWLTGGRGGSQVPAPKLFGVDLGISAVGSDFPRKPFGILCVVVLALSCLAVANLRKGGTGLQWLSVRSNERAAASAGIDVTATKLRAFALSSFLAGLGGCLYAYGHPNLSADSFVVFQSLALLSITYLGGIASIAGALLAGFFADGGVLTAMSGGGGSEAQFAIQGLVLIGVAALYPEGLAGAVYAIADRLRRLVRSGGSGPAPLGAPVDPTGPAGSESLAPPARAAPDLTAAG